MAIGWLGAHGGCHSSAFVAGASIMADLYPRYLANPTSVLTTSTDGLVYVSSFIVNSGVITYSTKKSGGSSMGNNLTLSLLQCDTTQYEADVVAGGAYDYASAAAMWGFAFSTVFMLWYLAKNLGLIINAVKRW